MSRRAITDRLAAEAGFTIIEVLVAVFVLTIGIVATLGVLTAADNATSVAQQKAALVSVAQGELEELRTVPYADAGLRSAPPPSADTEAPRRGPAASEQLVLGGTIDPGPVPVSFEGVRAKAYRYVTWRAQDCALVNATLPGRLADQLGIALAEVQAAITSDLCPGEQDTKRLTVVIVPTQAPSGSGLRTPVQTSTLLADPDATTTGADAGLKVESGSSGDGGGGGASQEASEQTFHLYDTPCSSNDRQPVAAPHATHDTGRVGATCAGATPPDLMGSTPIPGSAGESERHSEREHHGLDYSSDLARHEPEGLALKRDDRQGSCAAERAYAAADATPRRWSIHSWATPPAGVEAETARSNPRATVTFWTRTVDEVEGSGRVCVVLERASDGFVLGARDYQLANWPDEWTQLAVNFGIEHVTLAPGDRLVLRVRNTPGSDNDLELLYDDASAPSSLAVAMRTGKEIR